MQCLIFVSVQRVILKAEVATEKELFDLSLQAEPRQNV